MKPLIFVGSSRDDLRGLPREVRYALGRELLRTQMGLMPMNFKPMNEVAPGACEIRVRLDGAWRVIYVAKLDAAVFVLHAFQKKTAKTARLDIALARKRYGMIGDMR